MKFDKVQIEHISLAIKDFRGKSLPDGFKASAYFDVEIDDALYPPKPIMAYANYHTTGEEPSNNFSGGLDTPIINYQNLESLKFLLNCKNLKKIEHTRCDNIKDADL